MVMKTLRLVLLVLALSTSSVPAHAAMIGLHGGDFDPQSIFDPAFNPLALPCPAAELPSPYSCALYEILAEPPPPSQTFVVNSIDFRLLSPSGGLLGTGEIGETLFADGDFSDLGNLAASSLFDDGFTFTLFDDSIFCPDDCEAAFFSSDRSIASVSVVGVNGVANPGVTAIPEPATLFLVGPAWGALAVHRARLKARRESKINSTRTSTPAV
jgi:hypothetical protein